MQKDNILVVIFGAVFVFALIMILSQGVRTTGHATSDTTISNVTIDVYFSFELSDNLSNGIQFGTVSTLPATNVNGTSNYDWLNTTPNVGSGTSGYGTGYYMNVSSDSNTAVDFCLSAHNLNTSAGVDLLVGNESYFNHSSTNLSDPLVGSEIAFTGSYVRAGRNVAIGGIDYYRFWLDVPAGVGAGVYNNTVFIKAVGTGGAC